MHENYCLCYDYVNCSMNLFNFLANRYNFNKKWYFCFNRLTELFTNKKFKK